ncbi:polyketide cyclase [Nocardioides stalactiti]|uniref:polyketide cyclase n=1 Tax=Nocardioides stalactiti TaxID=2755356 RepID=UPI0016044DF9|nr:polyketide cyclase [Nocardioides stalactiti]
MIGDRWGSSDQEVGRSYPCDAYVDRPTMEAWRSVGVGARPEVVWPWLVQVRLAPYSYDWIDNLGRRSPRELRALADPVPGDKFTATSGRPVGRVLAVESGVHLTASIMGATMTYWLEPDGEARTRLILKIVSRPPRGLATALCLGDLVMARRQLLNLKELAERSAV